MEVSNNLNIDFNFIIFTRTHSLTRNAIGILVLNRNTDSRFVLAVLSKHKIDIEINSKSNIPSKQTRENYSLLCIVIINIGSTKVGQWVRYTVEHKMTNKKDIIML